MGLPWSADMGAWTLNGFNMITPAMKPMNLELLWSFPGPTGESVVMPGVDGVVPVEWFNGEAVHPIVMQLAGDVSHAGSATASNGAGLAANYAAVAFALRRAAWGGITCSTTVTRPDGVVLTGPVQVAVGPLGPETGGRIAKFMVTVTVPAGGLAVAA